LSAHDARNRAASQQHYQITLTCSSFPQKPDSSALAFAEANAMQESLDSRVRGNDEQKAAIKF
jgi:hypothetical protein